MTPLEALQATLAGEYAAVYVYGVLGGRVPAAAEPSLADRLREAYTVHRGRRDQLLAMVRDLDATPVASELSYEVPNAARAPGQLQRAAREIESRCCAVYAEMVGSTSQVHRRWAVDALTDAAVRHLGFGGAPEPFPGTPDL